MNAGTGNALFSTHKNSKHSEVQSMTSLRMDNVRTVRKKVS